MAFEVGMKVMKTWQYDGRAPWSDIVDWCWQTFETGQVVARWETICFESEQDYFLFKLRWS